MRRVLAAIALAGLAHAAGAQQITIRMMAGPAMGIPPKEASDPRSLARRAIFEEFHRTHPGIRVVNAGGLELKNERAESAFLMSMAGDTAPDVFYVNFRQYYNFIDQGFCRPLDDLVAKTPDAIARANPQIMKVLRSYDGRLYAIPWYQVAQALYYRKDHFAQAGLDPSKPPRNWEEFLYAARKLAEAKSGRFGFSFSSGLGGKAYHWSNFVWQAGGEVVVPSGQGGAWRSAVATPQAATALDFYRRLVAERWRGKDGKLYGPAAQISATHAQDITDGNVSMWFAYTNDVMLSISDLNPALIGVARLPAGPAGYANEVNAGMWAISSRVKDPAKLAACWEFIRYFAGEQAARVNTERYVDLGLANLVNPVLLEKYGYGDLARSVDPSYVEANRRLFETGRPEPYGRNCQQVYVVLDSALDRAVLEPQTPALQILKDVSAEMDQKLLGYKPPQVRLAQRLAARLIFGILALAAIGFVALPAGRALRARRNGGPVATGRKRRIGFMLLCLLPAVLSVGLWAYYPLARGLVMAFQDYRIVLGTRFVGFDNFIEVFTQPIFYKALWNSFVYVLLTIAIGFFLPIGLALALNEIPRGKVFFRTLFYLPAMTSSIVIAFLWRQFYDKTEQGLLNAALALPIGLLNKLLAAISWVLTGVGLRAIEPVAATHDWLGDPRLAMLAVVLPGIWAGAGPGSILYLAALKNIPNERFEAADIDGADWRQKIRFIVLPGLKPLILINLLGVFIAGFKAMENIFVLTGGGPLYATHTIGLEIWTNAFMFLKFGYATAAAWVMGAILIGFTVLQIRSLLRMRFTTSSL